MEGKRKLVMVLAYVAACTAVTLISVKAATADTLAAVLASSAGWCGGLATGIGLGMWGNAQEHRAKGANGGDHGVS